LAGSKRRVRWNELSRSVRRTIESIAGAPVVANRNCRGGFSPGLAARLTLANGQRVFAKAVDGREWPSEIDAYRAEARTSAVLPRTVPAPRLIGSDDDGQWVVLVFEDVDGHEPAQPWRRVELDRVVSAIGDVRAPIELPRDHPRLGGWREVGERLEEVFPWAADRRAELIDLADEGLEAARGDSLVHFDLYAHNVLLTSSRCSWWIGRMPGWVRRSSTW
jgi:hypothetical protein